MSNIPVRSQTPIANPPKSSASEKVDGLLADDVAVELAKSTLAAVLKFIERTDRKVCYGGGETGPSTIMHRNMLAVNPAPSSFAELVLLHCAAPVLDSSAGTEASLDLALNLTNKLSNIDVCIAIYYEALPDIAMSTCIPTS